MKGYTLKMLMFATVVAVAVHFGFVGAAEAAMLGLIGAVVAVSSTPITNATATPVVLNKANVARARLLHSRGICAVASGDSTASIYRFTRIRSSDMIVSVTLSAPGGVTGSMDFGLYKTAGDGGAVVDADFFASAVDLSTAVRNSDITFESGVVTVANMEKRVWEALGLSADPRLEYDVAGTLTTAMVGACSLCVGTQVTAAGS